MNHTMQVNVYLKYGFIEKININSYLDYLLKKFKNYFNNNKIPLKFNGNKYMSNEILKVAIFEEKYFYILERLEDSNNEEIY